MRICCTSVHHSCVIGLSNDCGWFYGNFQHNKQITCVGSQIVHILNPTVEPHTSRSTDLSIYIYIYIWNVNRRKLNYSFSAFINLFPYSPNRPPFSFSSRFLSIFAFSSFFSTFILLLPFLYIYKVKYICRFHSPPPKKNVCHLIGDDLKTCRNEFIMAL